MVVVLIRCVTFIVCLFAVQGTLLGATSLNVQEAEKLIHNQNEVVADFTGDYVISKETNVPVQKTRRRRAITLTDHVIDVFFIADYAAYQRWLKEYNGDSLQAETRMKIFYQWVAKSMNQRFSYVGRASDYIGSVYIKLVGIRIIKDRRDSPWTEESQQFNGKVNATLALTKFQQWLKRQSDIPENDHVMTFTGYDLQIGNNADVRGFATLNGICTEFSSSILEDDGTSPVGAVATHEMGHSLGANHDNEAAGCSDEDNYIMTTKLRFPPSEDLASRPWQFSTCAIKTFEETLTRVKCTLDNATPEMGSGDPIEQIGQTFNADEQCSLAVQGDSYLSRLFHSQDGYRAMCRGMYCSIGNTSSVTLRIPLDGTSCGHKQWCELGKCVSDQVAPIKVDNCPVGDHPNYDCHVNRCRSYMNTELIRHQCCETCPMFTSVPVMPAQPPSIKFTKTGINPLTVDKIIESTQAPKKLVNLIHDVISGQVPVQHDVISGQVPVQHDVISEQVSVLDQPQSTAVSDPSIGYGTFGFNVADGGGPTRILNVGNGALIIADRREPEVALPTAPVYFTTTVETTTEPSTVPITMPNIVPNANPSSITPRIEFNRNPSTMPNIYRTETSIMNEDQGISSAELYSMQRTTTETPRQTTATWSLPRRSNSSPNNFWTMFNKWFNSYVYKANTFVETLNTEVRQYETLLARQILGLFSPRRQNVRGNGAQGLRGNNRMVPKKQKGPGKKCKDHLKESRVVPQRSNGQGNKSRDINRNIMTSRRRNGPRTRFSFGFVKHHRKSRPTWMAAIFG